MRSYVRKGWFRGGPRLVQAKKGGVLRWQASRTCSALCSTRGDACTRGFSLWRVGCPHEGTSLWCVWVFTKGAWWHSFVCPHVGPRCGVFGCPHEGTSLWRVWVSTRGGLVVAGLCPHEGGLVMAGCLVVACLGVHARGPRDGGCPREGTSLWRALGVRARGPRCGVFGCPREGASLWRVCVSTRGGPRDGRLPRCGVFGCPREGTS